MEVNGGRRRQVDGKIRERRNMFGTLGGPELFLIFVVALIVFGPRKLPEIGKSLGKMMAEFRKASNEFRSTIENEVEAEKIRESMRIEAPRVDPVAPAAAITSHPAVSDYPDPGALETAPASEPAATAGATPAAETVPETVSRQPANTPIEPK
jgi:Tat protein translocase TatB subunit